MSVNKKEKWFRNNPWDTPVFRAQKPQKQSAKETEGSDQRCENQRQPLV